MKSLGVTLSAGVLVCVLLLSGCTAASPVTQTQTQLPPSAIDVGGTTVSVADTAQVDLTIPSVALPPTDSPPTAASSSADSHPSATPSSVPAQTTPTVPNVITAGGVYRLTDTREQTLVIDAGSSAVQLILQNAHIQSANGPAVYVRSAAKVTLSLAEGSENSLSDGKAYQWQEEDVLPDGAVFSRAPLVIHGNGRLQVTGNYKHGIVSKDSLQISDTTLTVTAQATAVEGKDWVKLGNSSITAVGGTDGIRATKESDPTKGFIYVKDAHLTVEAGNDTLQAEQLVKIENSTCQLTAGGGAAVGMDEEDTASHRGIKAGSDIYLTQTCLTADAADDTIHANGTVHVCGGTYLLSAGGDGVQAATDLAVSGSDTLLTVVTSDEGLEGGNLVLTDGRIEVTARRNGINAKGSLTLLSAIVTVNCPQTTLDFKTQGSLTQCVLIAVGEPPEQLLAATQQGVVCQAVGEHPANTTVTLTDSAGQAVVSFVAQTPFTHVCCTTPKMQKNQAYTLTVGQASATVHAG